MGGYATRRSQLTTLNFDNPIQAVVMRIDAQTGFYMWQMAYGSLEDSELQQVVGLAVETPTEKRPSGAK